MNVLDSEFLLRFAILAIALTCLLKYTFFRYSNDRDSLFSFMLFGHGVFIVAGLLHNVDISLGFAFGLFAIFSMLRYRTESISVRNMTYLFLVIVMSLISSVGPVTLPELVALNALLCMLAWVCETRILAERHDVALLTYDCLKKLKPECRGVLIAELRELTGLDVQSVDIIERNYRNKSARLRIHYPRPDLCDRVPVAVKDSPLPPVGKNAVVGKNVIQDHGN